MRLDIKREPYWLDLVEGVRVHVLPLTPAMMLKAQAAALGDNADGDAENHSDRLLRALAVAAIIGWEGVEDQDGALAGATAENIAAFMDLWPVWSAFDVKYLTPAILLEQEKNV